LDNWWERCSTSVLFSFISNQSEARNCRDHGVSPNEQMIIAKKV